MTSGLQALVLAIALLADAGVHDRHRADEPVIRAPGYAPLAFTAPPAGSYELPALGLAADGGVLDSEGREIALHDLYRDKLVVLSFIYTSCPDINGCPLAGFVLSQLQKHVLADSSLRGDVRLLSLSFDPGIDTPARMAAYGRTSAGTAATGNFSRARRRPNWNPSSRATISSCNGTMTRPATTSAACRISCGYT